MNRKNCQDFISVIQEIVNQIDHRKFLNVTMDEVIAIKTLIDFILGYKTINENEVNANRDLCE